MVKDEAVQRPTKYSLSHFHFRRRGRNGNQHRTIFGTATAPNYSGRDASTTNAVIPTTIEMERRMVHRQTILASTETHVRAYEVEADTSRNILFVLMDREKRGPNHVLSLSRWRRFRHHDRSKSGVSSGDRSPSTVLESPPRETTSSLSSSAPNNATNHHHHHVLSGVIVEEQEETTSFTETDEIVHASPTTASIPWPRSTVPPERSSSSIRRVSYPLSISRELQTYAEYVSTVRYHSACLNHLGGDDIIDADGNRPVSSHAVSTISICFSHDGLTVASTHGDHTVKISCCITGVLLQSLDGHPRTPWTVKYHPTHPHILASGCLGHQVRVWNWRQKQCLQMVRLEFAIISLAFHPSGTLLAIANGTKLHFWGINHHNTATTTTSLPSSTTASRLMESDQKHMLRCVHFPPAGDTIIIGGANPMQDDPRRRRSGIGGNNGMSFYLRLWDFDLERALESPYHETKDNANSNNNIPFGITVGKRTISNPRTFVPRALLYNDGGFDVSPDGKKLCVCAEYWLPDGVDNVMEQLHHEERLFEALMREKEVGSVDPQDKTSADSSSEEHHNGLGNNLLPNNLFANIHPATNHDVPRTPGNSSPEGYSCGGSVSHDNVPVMMMHNSTLFLNNNSFVPTTPPVSTEPRDQNLSPPPPPGRRPTGAGILRHARASVSITSGGQPVPHTSTNEDEDNGRAVAIGSSFSSGAMIGRYSRGSSTLTSTTTRGVSTPPPPPPSHAPVSTTMRLPHPYSIISPATSSYNNSGSGTPTQHLFDYGANRGRYVPHIAVISIDASPVPDSNVDGRMHTRNKPGSVARGYKPRLGQLMEAIPLDANKATAVTCVKFSPSTDFCLIGYGVRQPGPETDTGFHPVTAVYRIRGGMSHVSTMLSKDDDVNIARFHPDSGHGIVYGTKQGRVRVLSPRPWNFY